MKSSSAKLWRPLLLLLLVLTMLLIAPHLHLGERIQQLHRWVATLGPWGPVAFIAIYIVAVIAALPGVLITAAAGALFGSFWGVIYVSVGSVAGAGLAFLIARYFARDALRSWLQNSDKFVRLDTLVAAQGDIIVALVRLVPIFPFNFVNYAFGLTRVPFRTYLFWSWLCMLPGTVLYVVGTDAIAKGLRAGKVPWLLLILVAIVLAIITALVKMAKRRLQTPPPHDKVEASVLK